MADKQGLNPVEHDTVDRCSIPKADDAIHCFVEILMIANNTSIHFVCGVPC